jgi:cytochrome P450
MRRPPGPKPHFLIGNIPLAARDALDIFRRWTAEYGDIFYYRAAFIHVYFLNRPDLIEYVLIRNPQNFRKDHVVRNSRWLLGAGLLTAEGDQWRRQRRLIQPVFSRDRIAEYARLMADAAAQMLAQWRPGTIADIHEEMMRLTLRVVVLALFQSETADTAQISRAMNTLMRNSVGVRLLLPPFVRRLPLPGMGDVRRSVTQMDRAVYDLVRRQRSGAASGGLLALLMAARDDDNSAMSDEQLRDEVLTFLLAGHETTALALSWALYLLSRNPRAEQKLQEELDRVLGGRLPTFHDLPALTYTECVLKETMRLYPPAWGVAREAINDFEVDGYTIPARANIVMSQWLMHRDPRFFPEPDVFDADRWTTDAVQKLPRFAYFPFGGGPRQCIGASFAMTEAILILATISRSFRLVSVDGREPEPVPSLTLRPRNPIHLRIEPR